MSRIHGGRTFLAFALLASLAATTQVGAALAASDASISGVMFDDANRDGVRQPGEPSRTGLTMYLLTGDRSAFVAHMPLGPDGAFDFDGLAPGTYSLEVKSADWWALQADWVPTTTGSIHPRMTVVADDLTSSDFGIRRIVRSSTPLSEWIGPSGLTVQSFNDVVSAQEVHDRLVTGALVGDEAANVTVLHDQAATGTVCGASWVESGGKYSAFQATCNVSWSSWLTGPERSMSHEYGHAWSLYHAAIVQQDVDLNGYLAVRGLSGDPRLDTSHAWSRREMIAEDYRQLLGAPAGRSAPQENGEIAPASEVPGLLDYLRDEFTTAPIADPQPDPGGDPSEPSPSPEPDPVPTDSTVPTVVVVTPVAGELVSGSWVEVIVDASDDVTSSSALRVTSSIADRSAQVATWDPALGAFRATLDLKHLKGTVTLSVQAIDEAGNVTDVSIVVDVAKGPSPGNTKDDDGSTGGGGNGKERSSK